MAWFRTEKRFMDAAAAGDMETLRDYIAASNKYLDCRNKDTGDTPLLLAARHGQVTAMRFLLDKGASKLKRNYKTNDSAMHEALIHGKSDAATFLLEAGLDAYINTRGQSHTPLQLAILKDMPDILEKFIKSGRANLIGDDPPAVYFAVQYRKPEAVKILLASGADPSVPRVERREESFRLGSHRFRTGEKIIKTSPLELAVSANETEIALALLEAGAKPQAAENPLLSAAANGNIELATALLAHGANVRTGNEKSQTALHMAAIKNQPEMARFLLAQGVPKDVMDKDNRTALSYAQQFAMKEMIEILQGPLPAPVPVKPVAKPAPAAAPVSAPRSVVETIIEAATAPRPPSDSESWTLAGKSSVVHTSTYPALGRKLTEIFNFESRERLAITENMNLKTETMGQHESFDNLGDEVLTRALKEFRRLGGKVDEDAVFRKSLNKLPIKKP